MLKTVLRSKCSITGRSAFGLPAEITLHPFLKKGIWLKFPDWPAVPLEEASISHSKFGRYLKLSHTSGSIRVVEHLLGYLFAKGASNVLVELHGQGLPYDGTATPFHEAVGDKWQETNETLPIFTPRIGVRYGGSERFISFESDWGSLGDLIIEIKVSYPGFDPLIQTRVLGRFDVEQLATARPFGRGGKYQKLANFGRWLGWEGRFVTLDNQSSSCDNGRAQLEEIIKHRLLDLCGALAWVAPAGATLSGRVTSHMVGHAADIQLLRQLRSVDLRKI